MRGVSQGRAGLASARARAARAARALGGQIATGARDLALRLRTNAREESTRRRRLWIAVAVLLVLGPVAFTLARASTFTATVELFPSPVAPFPAERDPTVYRSFLDDPLLQREMLRNANALPSEYRDASIRPFPPRRTLLISVDSRSPARAQKLANTLGPQLIGALQRRLPGRATAVIQSLTDALRGTSTSRRDSRRIKRRIRRLGQLVAQPPTPAVLPPPVREPRLTHWADRVADALPGNLPERPNPLLAGLAGLLVALTLWVIGLGLFSRGQPLPWRRLWEGRPRKPARPVVLAPPVAATTGATTSVAEAPAQPAAAEPLPAPEPKRPRRGPREAASALLRDTPTIVLAGSGVVIAAIVMVLGADMATFRNDEWAFVLGRQGSSLDDFLRPHNEHLSLWPVIVFKALLGVVGMHPYWPYRLVLALLSVALGVLVYVYARRRIGRWWALVPAILCMLIGEGGYDIVWPFQIGFVTSVACGVGVLLCFDRRSRRSDLVAGGLLLLALSSSSIGIAVAAAAAVDIALSPGPKLRRALRILLVPLALYVAWWLHYHPSSETGAAGPIDAVRLFIEVSGAATTAIFGAPLSLRWLLSVALALAVAVTLVRRESGRRGLLVACSLPVAYWVLLILGRGSTGDQLLDSRYILPGSIFTACVLSEVLRGRTPRARPWIPWAAAVAVLLLMANQARYLDDIVRFETASRGNPLRGELAALTIAGRAGPIDPRFRPATVEAPDISAAPYFQATRRFGDPVPAPDALIRGLPPNARAAADRTYFAATGARPATIGKPSRAARVTCRVERGPTDVVLPAAGVLLRPAGTGQAAVALRRWGDGAVPVGTVPGSTWARVALAGDAAPTPVRVRISGARVRVCEVPA